MLNRLLRAVCYQEYTSDRQPRWAQRAVRIERPADEKHEVAA